MTESELAYEHSVIYQTRLGILCGTDASTPEQRKIATDEANTTIAELRGEEALLL